MAFTQAKLTIDGIVTLKDNSPLIGASVVLKHNGRIIAFSIANEKGLYSLSANLPDTGSFLIEARYIGHSTGTKLISISKKENIVVTHDFILLPGGNELREVVIKEQKKVGIRKDTIEYNAEKYQTKETRKIEDLLKNIDGFVVNADGTIRYRGRQVAALLLNGDDIAQDEYGILSKNLTSDIVDKIQVYDNYHRNRILGDVIKSGEVAINLKLKKQLDSKLGGYLSLGYGIKDRAEADGNLIWLNSYFKAIQILNYNNVSRQKGGNFFLKESEIESALYEIPSYHKLIKVGTVEVPSIPNDYALNNNDFLATTLVHAKLGSKIKINGNIGFLRGNQFNSFQSNSTTELVGLGGWQLHNEQQEREKLDALSGAITLLHDNQKKFAGEAGLQLLRNSAKDQYLNMSSIAVSDTLTEDMTDKLKGYRAHYTGAVKLTEKAVMSISAFLSNIPSENNFTINTSRLTSYWQIPDSIIYYRQLARYRQLSYNTAAWINTKLKSSVLRYGMEYGGNSITGNHSIQTSADLKNSYTDFIDLKQSEVRYNHIQISTASNVSLRNDISMDISGKFGVEKVYNQRLQKDNKCYIVWSIQTAFFYKIKAFASFSIAIENVRKMPSLTFFYPDTMLYGNASILQGAKELVPIEYSMVSLGYNTFKIAKGSSIQAGLWAKKSKINYSISAIYNPFVYQSNYAPSYGGISWGGNVAGKSFIYPIRSTLNFLLNYEQDIANRIINYEVVKESVSDFRSSIGLVTSLKFALNGEFRYNFNGYVAKQFANDGELERRNSVFGTEIRLKMRLNKDLYVGTLHLYNHANKQNIHLLDLFATYSFSKKQSIDLKIHNILNWRNYVQQNISANISEEQFFRTVPRYFLLSYNISF